MYAANILEHGRDENVMEISCYLGWKGNDWGQGSISKAYPKRMDKLSEVESEVSGNMQNQVRCIGRILEASWRARLPRA